MSAGTSPPNQPGGRPKKNSIGSWFSKKFGRRPSEAPLPSGDPSSARKGAAKDGRSRTSSAVAGANANADGQQSQFSSAFASNDAHALANTLTVPTNDGPAQARLTPPPQLDGIPTQEPLGTIDLPRSPRPDAGVQPSGHGAGTMAPPSVPAKVSTEPIVDGDTHASAVPSDDPATNAAPAIPTAVVSDLVNPSTDAIAPTTDDESSFDGRDSIGNRTMDTSKSRASTKPTTLMSLDTREPTVLPTTHIAQGRRSGGDDSFGNPHRLSTGPREGSAIQFAPSTGSRSGSGQIASTNSTGEVGSNFITVPSHSRPHPNNNPHPAAQPADNASILTLASSTAGMSLGGATSSRGHHHAPSLGGARSIGGSLMGDRRNSSDTAASLKALPPLSRRGSDESSRTRESVAASSTGQNSHQAMFVGVAAPGAPGDRVSLHRTPSQKTVATQMSVPLSTSASNAAINAYAKSEHTTNGSQLHLVTPPAAAQTTGEAEADTAVTPGASPKTVDEAAVQTSADQVKAQLAEPKTDSLEVNVAATETS
ncbi:uncharacterized protein PAN0_001c0471 [Moesziomyces antarcticus]|uniref:Uncharacterized protein n=1 Tax=Pseudozyma antarctica TaxID=84753 RepID=A0A5C3FEG8_PSEA2|nr:uncharacterized protein PAN0_001c0471 [Moesziomyces antarcticus]GAK62272.1 conserved hypothetical protein [Moesziomyces antarcticus]SPO42812.1 uncharacterized protein PSANT_00495 [Moesziomyces antarcticus]